MTEAVTNAIVHGSGSDPDKRIKVEWNLSENTLTLSICDDGEGPGPKNLGHPELPENPLETGGRGLYLIHNFCDDWKQWRGPDGYRLDITKRHPEIGFHPGRLNELEQALEEISLCYESLAAFYRLGDTLIQSDSVSHFIAQAVSDLMPVVKAEYVKLHFSGSLQDSLLGELKKLNIFQAHKDGSQVEERVYAKGEEFIWESAQEVAEDSRLCHCSSGFCCPIKAGGETFGYITIGRFNSDSYFRAGDLNTVRTFTDLFGIAVVNANHEIIHTREERVQRELEIASEIQQNLLPAAGIPETEHYRIWMQRKSAREVAGDYMEACLAKDGSLFLVTVDVMGKGVSAALLAAMFRTALHINLNNGLSLKHLIHSLNRILCYEVGDLTLFATCGIARIPPPFRTIEVVNAGHCPVLILNKSELLDRIDPSGPPLGLFKNTEYTVERFPLKERVGLLMVTDGLYEWERSGQIWGWGSFMEFVESQLPLNPERFWESLQLKIREAIGSEDTGDDQTMLYWEAKL